MKVVLASSSGKPQTLHRTVFCAAWFVGVLGIPMSALAQPPDAQARAEAQKLYEDGAKDMEAAVYSRACPKFEAAWKILPDHIRTGVTLAECLDKWGKPASALDVLEQVLPLATSRGDQAKTAEVEASIADLKQRVPRLTIRVSSSLSKMPGLAISRSGVPLPPASWGNPMPLDPGEYEIEASAVDQSTWKTTVQLELGDPKTVDVTPGWKLPDAMGKAPPRPVNGLRVAGFVGIGLGAVGLATWGVLGGLAISKYNASTLHCSKENVCDPDGFGRRNEAIALGNGATVGLIAGGLLAATGITLAVVSVSGKNEKRGASGASMAQTNVFVGPSGVHFRATW